MRKKQAKKRPLLPDPKFNDQLVTRFVNMMMWDGKKSIAFKLSYAFLGLFAPYLDLRCVLPATPAVSKAPLTM